MYDTPPEELFTAWKQYALAKKDRFNKERRDILIRTLVLMFSSESEKSKLIGYREEVMLTLTTAKGRRGEDGYVGWKEDVFKNFDDVVEEYFRDYFEKKQLFDEKSLPFLSLLTFEELDHMWVVERTHKEGRADEITCLQIVNKWMEYVSTDFPLNSEDAREYTYPIFECMMNYKISKSEAQNKKVEIFNFLLSNTQLGGEYDKHKLHAVMENEIYDIFDHWDAHLNGTYNRNNKTEKRLPQELQRLVREYFEDVG